MLLIIEEKNHIDELRSEETDRLARVWWIMETKVDNVVTAFFGLLKAAQ